MKQFEIPAYYRSPIIGKVKIKRRLDDPLKRDLSPSILTFGKLTLLIPRHFGFCYGVENAIEKSYRAIYENPDKRIFLISQMIHNPEVNRDLEEHGVRFIQDTNGKQLIPWEEITPEDIVIVPAFGQTIETEKILSERGIDYHTYNTTCPFVEKVWNRSSRLGGNDYTVVIHGKHKHEETRATFSHSKESAPSIIVKNIEEANYIADYIFGRMGTSEFMANFSEKISENFNPEEHLQRIGVVNQTTMLATETQDIADFLRNTMITKYGVDHIKEHFADTRDTLCYATNDNQSATLELLKQDADLAIVIGGYNSSNTSHLVELLESRFPTYFIKNQDEIIDHQHIRSFDFKHGLMNEFAEFLPDKRDLKIIITSGASCPDSVVDRVIQKLIYLVDPNLPADAIRV